MMINDDQWRREGGRLVAGTTHADFRSSKLFFSRFCVLFPALDDDSRLHDARYILIPVLSYTTSVTTPVPAANWPRNVSLRL